MFGFTASNPLTALVNVSSSLLSEAKVCHTSMVISPSEEDDSVELSEPKSRQPGANNKRINENTSILNFIEGLKVPLSIDTRRDGINKGIWAKVFAVLGLQLPER